MTMQHDLSHPKPALPLRRLRWGGLLLVIAAIAAVALGLMRRRDHMQVLQQDAVTDAVPVVSLVHADTGTGAQDLVLPGDVQAFYDAPIYARVNGYVQAWHFDIGARVKKGDVLATIDTPELDEQLDQARAELTLADANLALARTTAQRWHALLSTNSVSQQSADEKLSDEQARQAMVASQRAHVNALLAQSGFKRLAAPFDGVVTARNTDIGALINQGASDRPPLFKVADVHEMRVYVRVPQAYASQLHAGLQATLTQPQYVGQRFPARLETTSNAVSAESRTVLVELLAPNPDGKLWPGTYAQVDFHLDSDEAVLRVPTSALIFREHGAELATLTPDNRIKLVKVTLGRNSGTYLEILSGLAPDARIVNAPPDTLEDGETVRVAAP